MVLVFFALFGREFLTSMCFSRGPQWGFAGCGIRPFLVAGFGISSKIVAGYGIQISAGCGIGHKIIAGKYEDIAPLDIEG